MSAQELHSEVEVVVIVFVVVVEVLDSEEGAVDKLGVIEVQGADERTGAGICLPLIQV